MTRLLTLSLRLAWIPIAWFLRLLGFGAGVKRHGWQPPAADSEHHVWAVVLERRENQRNEPVRRLGSDRGGCRAARVPGDRARSSVLRLTGRTVLVSLAAVLALAITTVGALAYYTSSGTGSASASVGSLTAASISGPGASAGSVTINWTSQASLSGGSHTGITYTVERKLGSAGFTAIPTGSCSGSLPYGTASCTDAVGTGGSYTYEVVADYGSGPAWTATSNTFTVNVSLSTAVSTVTFSPGSLLANATSTWTVGFKGSATGALAAGDTILLTFSAGFGVPASGAAVTLPTGFSHCSATETTSGQVATITLASVGGTCALAGSTAATLTVAGVTNAAAATYVNTSFSLATSKDAAPVSPTAGITIAPTSVTGVTFTPASLAANATSTWTVGFTSSASGNLNAGDTISVTFNAGVTLPASGAAVTLPTGFSGCSAAETTSGHVATITLSGASCALANSAAGTLTIAGVTNPVAGTLLANTFTLSTSQDVTAVSPATGVTISTSVSNVTFTPASFAANTTSTWSVGFRTSATGALASGNTISVAFNSNFAVPASPTVALTGGFANCRASAASTTGNVVTITLANNGGTCGLANGATATLTIAGITNPGAASYANTSFSVATTKDPAAANPPTGITITPTSVTGVTFSPASSAANATSTWTVRFTTSATGALAAGNTISVAFNNNFTVPASPTVALTGGFTSCKVNTASTTGNVVTITLANNTPATCALANGTAATLTVAGVTNAAAATYVNTSFSLATSKDAAPVSPTAGITIAPTSVSGVTFTPASLAANATSTWTVGFTSSASGNLNAGDTISVTFNSGVGLPVSGAAVTLPTGFSGCSAAETTSGHVATITLSGASCALANSAAGTLTIAGVTNPVAGTLLANTFTLSTSQDVTAVSPATGVTISTSVSNVTFTPASFAANTTSTWSVGFRTSATGALVAGNTISVTFSPGFGVPASGAGVTLPTGFSHCSATETTSGQVATVTLASVGGTCALAGSTTGVLTIAGVTNPGAASYANTSFSVATTKDPAAANPPTGITITPTSVTGVTFSPASSAANATSTWTVGFTSSASGNLNAGDTVSVTFNAGVTLPASGAAVTLPTGFSNCSAAETTSGHVATITLSGASCALANSTAGTLTIAGVTNPAAGTLPANTFNLSTSEDTNAVNPGSNLTITAGAAITLQDQGVAGSGGGVNGTPSVETPALTSPPVNGDTLILLVGDDHSDAATIQTVSGGGVTTWTKVVTSNGTSGNGEAEIWYGLVTCSPCSSSDEAVVVTMGPNTANTNWQLANVSEWSGIAPTNPVDGPANSASGTPAAATFGPGSVTASQTGDLIITDAWVANTGFGWTTGPINATSGYTPLSQTNGGGAFFRGWASYQLGPSIGAISATWTENGNGAPYSTAIAAFRHS